MTDPIPRMDAKALKACLHDGAEIALLDAREEVPFDRRHILMAACVPLGRIETIVDAAIPRRTARVVWCDDGDGLAGPAAERMAALGYSNVALLDGGIDAWEAAGYRLYEGVHVPSKAFAEVIEHEAGTPYIDASGLKAMMDDGTDFVLLDSRTYEEYHDNSIPGAISVPGAELVYRFKDLVPSPETTVVVNCGGRTRSIIGAQSLISAGFPNRIMSFKNGTQGWHLAGFKVVKGAAKTVPDVSPQALEASVAATRRLAETHGIWRIDAATYEAYVREKDRRSLYVFDVRTRTEYEAGHLPGVKHIPGGQLVQETDRHVAVWGARVVLVDDTCVRAIMTAYWMQQMGWDVAVLAMADVGGALDTGPYVPRTLGLEKAAAELIPVAALKAALDDGTATVVDLDWSKSYARGHIPGAWYMIRARIAADIAGLPGTELIVLTSPDGNLARLAASATQASVPVGTQVKVLAGGTAAWTAAGLPLEQGMTGMASAAEDIRLRAREKSGDKEAAMNHYLAWEIELVNQMATDDDQRFRVRV